MVVTVGFFDGVHLGHRKVLNQALQMDQNATVVTFWPHPRAVLGQDARNLSLLSSPEEKAQLLRDAGVRNIKIIDFSREFASRSARDFVQQTLVGELGCTTLVLGYDNRLGSDALTTEQVATLCRDMGLEVVIVDPYIHKGEPVSSTRVRKALAAGDVCGAAQMLGRAYSITGVVVPGNQLGRTIGFPTANVAPLFPLKAIPAGGVYVTDVRLGDRHFRGMTNIGTRPTVDSGDRLVIETNIFDFDEDIYALEVELSFTARIRDERKFASLDALRHQLELDRAAALR